jgi:hypothetical protein
MSRRAWADLLARERAYVPLGARALRWTFDQQHQRVLDHLVPLLERSLSPRGRQIVRTLPDAELIQLLRVLLAGRDWSALFQARIEKVRRQLAEQTGQQTLNLVGGSGAGEFQFTQQLETQLQRQGAALVIRVNETTASTVIRKVRDVLAAQTADQALGERTAQIRKAIGEGFETRKNQARTIARTEMGEAASVAQLEGYRQSAVVSGQRWNTSRDDAVRDSHKIDGQTVPLGSQFRLTDGVSARYPLDGNLPAAHRANCRCFLTPELVGDLA